MELETTELDVLTSQLQQTFKQVQDDRTTRRYLKSTLKDLTPLVQEIKQYNEQLNPPREEIKTLIRENDAQDRGEDSIKNLCWHKFMSWIKICIDGVWHKRNGDFDDSYVVDNKRALVAKDVKDTLYKLREILEILNKEDFEKKVIGSRGGLVFKGPFGVRDNPEFTIGFDLLLIKSKMELLRDGRSTLVLTGLGGLGKTTLATKLCWDEQIKGKFKENILFVVFSKTPQLKIIVERLFEHCGYPVPEFQSDEDAVNRLGLLLRKIEGSPILLVLDDVWPGSEDLVEKFQFQISDYKILVTSRVAFSRFDKTFILKPLVHEDAVTLFHHYSQLEKNNSNIPNNDFIQKVVGHCKGLPIAIKVIATSLRNRPYELWQKIMKELSQGHSILYSNTELLTRLQKILDVLEDNPINKECFMDLALFPEDQRIPVAALIDMWAELYRLDDDGIEAMSIINKLDSMNLANVLIARKNASDTENYYYNNHFIVLHDLLRELGIYQSTQEPIEKRKRLLIDENENIRDRWLAKKQRGTMTHILSKFHRWCVKPKPQQVPARTLSISTDETCATDWSQIQPAQTEVLILNLQTKRYSFPELMEKMIKLKVLIAINHGFRPSELNNFELLSSLSNLNRIRLEGISVPSFGTLKTLKKLSLYMCKTKLAFEKGSILISDAFPNLEDFNIDYCKDVVALPNGVCDILPLKKLSVTNCHNLFSLPQEIGKLENLELLRLISCTDLEELPDSIDRLSNLRLLDISNCISLSSLPDDIGNLRNLRNLFMTSCASCELPFSVVNLDNLKVICDEETAASWEAFQFMIPNLIIEVPKVDVNLNWLHAVRS
ncbi:probable disease resistance protein At5g66900 [Cicer arietinum]|uniref:NBS-LRR protein n=1 Tax=Cicer arietinum TaxID=3827 RepID=W0M058_CICAR|nr:probable disease resistance protein At5g66900 [Cicer arietinum]AHG28990.1 NBS-LRR protein [Cicer arietinum]